MHVVFWIPAQSDSNLHSRAFPVGVGGGGGFTFWFWVLVFPKVVSAQVKLGEAKNTTKSSDAMKCGLFSSLISLSDLSLWFAKQDDRQSLPATYPFTDNPYLRSYQRKEPTEEIEPTLPFAPANLRSKRSKRSPRSIRPHRLIYARRKRGREN